MRVTDHAFADREHSLTASAGPDRVLVLGLGNPILTDDGIGVCVAEAVGEALPEGAAVDVIAVSAGGLSLMEQMVGYRRAIMIDALQGSDSPPGTVHKMSLDALRDLSATRNSTCVHDMSFVTALDLGEKMGLDLPEEVIVYAIAVENVVDFSEEPTPAVSRAIEPVVAAVLADLGFED